LRGGSRTKPAACASYAANLGQALWAFGGPGHRVPVLRGPARRRPVGPAGAGSAAGRAALAGL